MTDAPRQALIDVHWRSMSDPSRPQGPFDPDGDEEAASGNDPETGAPNTPWSAPSGDWQAPQGAAAPQSGPDRLSHDDWAGLSRQEADWLRDSVAEGSSTRTQPRRFLLLATSAVLVAAGLFLGVAISHDFWRSHPRTTAHGTGGAVAARVDPALVDINLVLGDQSAEAAATGIVLSPSGLVLTNNHVVAGATVIKATDLGDGRTYSATVLGYDTDRDVALIQLRGASRLQTADLGNSATVTVGQTVIGIGNAGGLGGMPSAARGRSLRSTSRSRQATRWTAPPSSSAA